MRRISSRLILALTLLTALGLTLTVSSQQAQAAPTCVDVRGTFLQSNPTGPATIENKIGADLAGDCLGIITEAKQPEADGTLRLSVTHVFMTPQGNLYAVAESILTPITQTASQTDDTFTERTIWRRQILPLYHAAGHGLRAEPDGECGLLSAPVVRKLMPGSIRSTRKGYHA
jgi:hypothetical protein